MSTKNVGKSNMKTLWTAVFLIALLIIYTYMHYSITSEKPKKPVAEMTQLRRKILQNAATTEIRKHRSSTSAPHKRYIKNDNLQHNVTSNVNVSDNHVTKRMMGNKSASNVGGLQSSILSITKVAKPTYVRVLCWVMCDPSDLERRVKHVKATWASRCDVTLYMSSKENKTFPTIGLNVTAGRDHIASKAKAAWKYIYKNYFYKAEFFMKTDPDTYVVVHNLKRYLANYDTNEALLFGHRFQYPGTKNIYTSGGSGFVLSREALRKFVTEALQFKVDCMPDGQFEDLKTGSCLQKVGVTAVDTRDTSGRETFMVFPFNTHYSGKYPAFYKGYDMNGQLQGDQCCSHNPISFHYIKTEDMYYLDYTLRKVAQAEARAERDFIFIKKAEEKNQTKLI